MTLSSVVDPLASSLVSSETDTDLNAKAASASNSPNAAVNVGADRPYQFPAAYPNLNLSALFRSVPEDFVVYENLGFTPSGDGEHCLIHIEKIGQNTHWVAEQLALLLNLDKKAVGYCGRKDRHAVTRQWLSVYDPHRKVDFSGVNGKSIGIEGVQLLESTRHTHKLRPGDHQSNLFCIRLRDVMLSTSERDNKAINVGSVEGIAKEGAKKSVNGAVEEIIEETAADANKGTLECCIEQQSKKRDGHLLSALQMSEIISEIKQRFAQGIPNYFGPQRFGREGNNLRVAGDWFERKRLPGRKQKSIIMSAARSYLFNKVLAIRVEQNCWASAIDGDVLIDDLPTAPLWGRGRLTSQSMTLAIETEALAEMGDWCHGLEHCGLKQERRSTVLYPRQVSVHGEGCDLVIAFDLTSGAFATSILAEICRLVTPAS